MSYYYMDNEDDQASIAEIFDVDNEATKPDEQHSRLEVQEGPINSCGSDWMVQQNGRFYFKL